MCVPSGILPNSVFFMDAACAVAAVLRIKLKVNVTASNRRKINGCFRKIVLMPAMPV
jgi:hypothetical protein